jgi:uncharacterized protein YcbK (DUF882 family)
LLIHSGYRSWKYNQALREAKAKRLKEKDLTKIKIPAPKSQHMGGRAADIAVTGMTGLDLAKLAIDVAGCDIAIGLGKDFIHVDTRGCFTLWPYTGGVDQKDTDEICAYRHSKCPGRKRCPTKWCK